MLKRWFLDSTIPASLFALMLERPQGQSVKSAEDAVPWLSLEIQNSSHGSIVLAHSLVQMHSGHLSFGEVHAAKVGDAALLGAVDPDFLAHHQMVCTLIEDHLSRRLSSQPGL